MENFAVTIAYMKEIAMCIGNVCNVNKTIAKLFLGYYDNFHDSSLKDLMSGLENQRHKQLLHSKAQPFLFQ